MIRAGVEDWRQNRETPWWLVRYLEDFLGCSFELDAFASSRNAKAVRWWDKEADAFSKNWGSVKGWIFCNPPFKMKWEVLEKFSEAKRVCVVLPCAPWEYWWQEFYEKSDVSFNSIGRVHFKCGPDAPFPRKSSSTSPSGGTTIFIRGACFALEPGSELSPRKKMFFFDAKETREAYGENHDPRNRCG